MSSRNVINSRNEGKEGGVSTTCCRRIVCTLVLVIIAVVVVIVLLFAFGGDEGPKSFFVGEDPPGLDAANRWRTFGNDGLSINVLNAMEDKWNPYFDEMITAWDNGDPDALELRTRKIPHELECEPLNGQIKICNGDYGETAWRGIAKSFLREGYMVNSAAKLNDFHLDTESQDQKKYTMCHELGHTFGLPHTDVNYYNWDRGDCMDYTVRPGNNNQPGEYNFNLLRDMYGSVTGPSVVSALEELDEATVNGGDEENDGDKTESGKGGKRRGLGAPAKLKPVPANIVEQYDFISTTLETMSCREWEKSAPRDNKVKILHEHAEAEGCEFDLYEGYTVQIQKLLVRKK